MVLLKEEGMQLIKKTVVLFKESSINATNYFYVHVNNNVISQPQMWQRNRTN